MNIDWDSEFERIFRENYTRLLFHVNRIVGQTDEAEDIVGDVFFEIWNRRHEIEIDHDGIKAYLYRSVSNRALNSLRRRGTAETSISLLTKLNEIRLDHLISNYNPDSDVRQIEIRQAIEQAIESLPDKCRQAFTLSYIHNLKNQDIADIMNVSPRTVDAHIYRALRVLRDKLKYILPLAFFILTRLSDFNINFVN